MPGFFLSQRVELLVTPIPAVEKTMILHLTFHARLVAKQKFHKNIDALCLFLSPDDAAGRSLKGDADPQRSSATITRNSCRSGDKRCEDDALDP